MSRYITFVLLFLLILFVSPSFVMAATASTTNDVSSENSSATVNDNIPDFSTSNATAESRAQELQPFKDVVSDALRFMFSLASILATVNVVWQGFKLMGSNPNSHDSAKQSVVKSIVGLGIILFSWSIVAVLVQIIGTSASS